MCIHLWGDTSLPQCLVIVCVSLRSKDRSQSTSLPHALLSPLLEWHFNYRRRFWGCHIPSLLEDPVWGRRNSSGPGIRRHFAVLAPLSFWPLICVSCDCLTFQGRAATLFYPSIVGDAGDGYGKAFWQQWMVVLAFTDLLMTKPRLHWGKHPSFPWPSLALPFTALSSSPSVGYLYTLSSAVELPKFRDCGGGVLPPTPSQVFLFPTSCVDSQNLLISQSCQRFSLRG